MVYYAGGMNKQQQIDVLTRKNRDLADDLRRLELKYGLIADLVNDAGCLLNREQPIDAHILTAFREFNRGELAMDMGPYVKPRLIGFGTEE